MAEIECPPLEGGESINAYRARLLEKVAQEVANWDRTQGYNKMQSIIQANPEIDAVISGNDEMALGAIAALKEAGELEGVIVGGFDGSPDAVDAIKAGDVAMYVDWVRVYEPLTDEE